MKRIIIAFAMLSSTTALAQSGAATPAFDFVSGAEIKPWSDFLFSDVKNHNPGKFALMVHGTNHFDLKDQRLVMAASPNPVFTSLITDKCAVTFGYAGFVLQVAPQEIIGATAYDTRLDFDRQEMSTQAGVLNELRKYNTTLKENYNGGTGVLSPAAITNCDPEEIILHTTDLIKHNNEVVLAYGGNPQATTRVTGVFIWTDPQGNPVLPIYNELTAQAREFAASQNLPIITLKTNEVIPADREFEWQDAGTRAVKVEYGQTVTFDAEKREYCYIFSESREFISFPALQKVKERCLVDSYPANGEEVPGGVCTRFAMDMLTSLKTPAEKARLKETLNALRQDLAANNPDCLKPYSDLLKWLIKRL